MLEQLEMLLKKQANLNLERQEETQATLDEEIETQRINRQREEKKERIRDMEMMTRMVEP